MSEMMTDSTASVMDGVRKMAKDSGLTQRALGLRMGYPENSARQSAAQFLKSMNPTISVLTRFANAMDVSVESLL